MDDLSKFLKAAREKSNLTQAELAKSMGYTTPQFVSNWERKTTAFPVQKAKKFVRLTKCDPAKLFAAVMGRYHNRVVKHFPEPK